MPEKVWEYRNKSISREAAEKTARLYSLPPVIAALLLNRGISTEEQIRAFLSKSMKYVHNPMLLPDMDKAAARIGRAVREKEKIVIYGDYDVDGITSTVLMYSFLKELGADVDYYIPERNEEGYGINILAVNRLSKAGTKLLISVDCGITAVGEVELAKLQGMDVIITDHHTCQEKLPRAEAVINPKIPDCGYPFESLAGVGVALKLMLACAMDAGLNATEYFNKYAVLAAIGTVADVVPLTDENRIIVNKGLSMLADSGNAGLEALIASAGLDGRPMNNAAIAFGLAPRLNAAGRLGSAKTAVELLLCEDKARAAELAAELEAENTSRRAAEQEIFDAALKIIENDAELEKKKVIVAAGDGWHPGVIGIAAARITERFYKPCILISCDEAGNGKGSGRSIPGFNLFDALVGCSDLLTSFGGHAAAAGLNIKKEDIAEFEKQINKYAGGVLSADDTVPKLSIDCELDASFITLENAKCIQKLEPFGAGNETPVFSLHGVRIVSLARIGADNKHLRLAVSKGTEVFNCIAFNFGEYAERLKRGDGIHIAFNLDVNCFRGEERVQLRIKDIIKA